MSINPIGAFAGFATTFIAAAEEAHRNNRPLQWVRGNAELSIGASNGSLFIRLRQANGVTTQWDFTTQESIKDIRDMCNRLLEGKV